MLTNKTKIRVRYGETDRMGYVYYGNHALYFEVGRVEMLRAMGYPYDEMERDGIMCPVTFLDVRYVRPALYDEELTVTTTVKEKPTQFIHFQVEIHNQNNKLVSTGNVTLAFVDAQTRRKCDAPDRILNLFDKPENEVILQ
jgi:acyl-CoA thioester hydrolase